MFRRIFWMIGAACLMLLASCSGESYQNAIPKGCTALMAIDLNSIGDDGSQQPAMLQSVFGLGDLRQSGIDLSSKIYLFESSDGLFGLVADVSKSSLLEQWLNGRQQAGTCQLLPERKGKKFAVMNDAWMMAYDSDKLLLMGPVVPAAYPQLTLQMARYMDQDEKQGMRSSPMMNRLSEMQSLMALVAQTAALPESLAAAFAMGAPKDADASQVLLAADMSVRDGTLMVEGTTFSFNKSVERAIEQSLSQYRPLTDAFLSRIPLAAFAWMANVEGDKFYAMLQQNKSLKAMLTGANVSFDFHQVVGDIQGDMVVVADSIGSAAPRIMLLAQKGGGEEYFAATDKSLQADAVFSRGQSALSAEQQSLIKGARCAMIVQLSQVGNAETVQLVQSVLRPFFGDIRTIVYLMK